MWIQLAQQLSGRLQETRSRVGAHGAMTYEDTISKIRPGGGRIWPVLRLGEVCRTHEDRCMGWTAGRLNRPFSARAAIAFDLGQQFADRVLATALRGRVIYAAVRSADSNDVFGLVLLTERRKGVLYTKPVSEDLGPADDDCPARILDLLTAPRNRHASEWRRRCRARISLPRPRPGQTVVFSGSIRFTDGSQHRTLVFQGGSRFLSADGITYRVPSWQTLDYKLR